MGRASSCTHFVACIRATTQAVKKKAAAAKRKRVAGLLEYARAVKEGADNRQPLEDCELQEAISGQCQ